MALYFSINDKGNYLVTEVTNNFFSTITQVIEYQRDLSQKRFVSKSLTGHRGYTDNTPQPWIETTQACRDWFVKFYEPHFNQLNLDKANDN